MENHEIMRLFFDFMHLHRQRVQTFVDEAKLYHGQLPILEAVKENDGCTQNELAERLHVSAPSVTNSIKRLEKNGFVTKETDERDCRRSNIRITGKGRTVAEGVRKRFDEADEMSFKNLSEKEKEQLYSILNKMVENLRREDKE